MKECQAPKLTKYGKVQNFIQAGSVLIATGDITGDETPDQAFDTDGDGRADVVVGGASGNQTPVTFDFSDTSESGYYGDDPVGIGVDFYDSDGDGQADFAIADTNATPTLQSINSYNSDYFTLSDSGTLYILSIGNEIELSNNGDWSNPTRD